MTRMNRKGTTMGSPLLRNRDPSPLEQSPVRTSQARGGGVVVNNFSSMVDRRPSLASSVADSALVASHKFGGMQREISQLTDASGRNTVLNKDKTEE